MLEVVGINVPNPDKQQERIETDIEESEELPVPAPSSDVGKPDDVGKPEDSGESSNNSKTIAPRNKLKYHLNIKY